MFTFAAVTLAVSLGLGVGATDSNTIVVKIDGKETPVTLAGTAGGSERGTAFAKCLVAGRVVRVSGPRSAATVTLLDDTSVAAHIAEFLQTQTSSDPCTLGKAAYQPKVVQVKQTSKKPLPAVTKKPVREVHVSFASGKMSQESVKTTHTPASQAEYGPRPKPAAPAPKPPDQPSYLAPTTVTSYQQPPAAGTYAPPTVTTTTLPQANPQPALQQQGTQQLPQQNAQPMPTTTYKPPV